MRIAKGLEYYGDINQKIPRAEIVEYDKLFASWYRPAVVKQPSLRLARSYRRGKQTSGDIDCHHHQ